MKLVRLANITDLKHGNLLPIESNKEIWFIMYFWSSSVCVCELVKCRFT